jgi:hypothetical protein
MSDRANVDDIRWREFHRAALACGIDPSTLPTPQSICETQKSSEPEPVPELEPPVLSDADWQALSPLMPAKSKYLSKLAPREFLNLAVFYVWCGRKFNLLPTERIERFRAKLYRAFLAGTFTALESFPPGTPAPEVSDEIQALLAELADAERIYRMRHDKFRAERTQKLAREKDRSKSRGM